jgi:hypothetical protein
LPSAPPSGRTYACPWGFAVPWPRRPRRPRPGCPYCARRRESRSGLRGAPLHRAVEHDDVVVSHVFPALRAIPAADGRHRYVTAFRRCGAVDNHLDDRPLGLRLVGNDGYRPAGVASGNITTTVFGPAMPSAASPRARWNCLTASGCLQSILPVGRARIVTKRQQSLLDCQHRDHGECPFRPLGRVISVMLMLLIAQLTSRRLPVCASRQAKSFLSGQWNFG